MNYREYLQSDHWRELRERAIRAAGGICEACKTDRALQGHHRIYRNKLEEGEVGDIMALCDKCHAAIHTLPRRITDKEETISAIRKIRSVAPKASPFDHKERETKWRASRKQAEALRIKARLEVKKERWRKLGVAPKQMNNMEHNFVKSQATDTPPDTRTEIIS